MCTWDGSSVKGDIEKFNLHVRVQHDALLSRGETSSDLLTNLFTAYDAVKYFEDITISKKDDSIVIPEMYYAVYQNIIAINHFKNEAYIFAHCFGSESNIDAIDHLIKVQSFSSYDFESKGTISSNLSDEEFKSNVKLAKKHCARGDVFQLVLSKKFQKDFKGDDENRSNRIRSYGVGHCPGSSHPYPSAY